MWIDHFRRAVPALQSSLVEDAVVCHPYVLEELALGTLGRRSETLALLGNLRVVPVLSHQEILALVESHGLWGRGLSAVDVHLLGSVLISSDVRLWTRDRRLAEAADELGVLHAP